MARKKRSRNNCANSVETLELQMLELTNRTYNFYMERIFNLMLSRFKWSGLPEEIDERFVEWVLLRNGNGLFFFEDNPLIDSVVFTQSNLTGGFDLNHIPNYREAYSISNDLTKRNFNSSNSVICWNNRTRSSDMNMIIMTAQRLTNITRIIDTNMELQRQQAVIIADESERGTALAQLKRMFNFMPIVIGRSKSVATKPMELINANVEYKGDKLLTNKHDVWNEFLTSKGFNNANTDKKERQITSEVESNNGEVFAGRWSEQVSREEACEKINKMFGLKTSVEWRGNDEIRRMVEMEQVSDPLEAEGGDSIGII